MRVLVVLALFGVSAAQFPFFQGGRSQRGRSQGGRQLQQQFAQKNVDDQDSNRHYHYSWRHGQRPFTGQGARQYCRNLGGGWQAISINDLRENSYVKAVVGGENLEYIWTGGEKRGGSFSWADGSGVGFSDWSHTGGKQVAQPDNREFGSSNGRRSEDCLGVLNNFYGDGIKWHDVECSHRKPVICEKKA